ncbi:phosphotransferase [Tersicoccus sp. Bi-70]|uniref:protein kinase domain-containing protein n=1 Tax=Tersicoccus sp. Bi-70 TaxID=1897634 RepID=UPI00097724A7|nr:phosphotransferase [Tersicoccus sp. Bi-70]OMH33182.1 hypothetical protein BGP79_06540 [Tersicoccus sp. Bi-70]
MDMREDGQTGTAGCVRDTTPQVPGHETLRLIGEGASSVVWLVRRGQDGALLAGRVETDPLPSRNAPGVAGRPPTLGSAAAALGPLAADHLVHPRGEAVAGCRIAGHRHRVMLMDHLPGGSLAQVVAARGPLSIGETVTVITPLAQLLAAAHAAGLTHGDVSPGNVLFAVDGRPVLADWELAGLPGRPGPPGTGTDGFRDPVATPAGRSGPAADVYALAAVAWFCLTGRVPGPTEHRPPLPVLVPAVSRPLALLLDRGMDPDPQARPNAAELARGVFAVAVAEPVDLHASVHPSVRPDLVTRRTATEVGRRRRARRSTGRGSVRAGPLRGGGWAAGPVVASGRRRTRVGATRAEPTTTTVAPRWRGWGIALLLAVTVGGVAALLAPVPPPGGAAVAGRTPTGPVAATSGPVSASDAASDSGPGSASSLAAVRPEATAAAGATSTVAPPGVDASRSPRPAAATPVPATASPAAPAAPAERHPGSASASADPVAAARALTEQRTRAFREGRWDLLADVSVPGSPAALADRAAAAALVAASGRLADLRVEVTCAQRIWARNGSGGPVVVRLCARFTGYRQVDRTGTVVRTVAASPVQDVRLQLVRAGDGRWRIDRVSGTAG